MGLTVGISPCFAQEEWSDPQKIQRPQEAQRLQEMQRAREEALRRALEERLQRVQEVQRQQEASRMALEEHIQHLREAQRQQEMRQRALAEQQARHQEEMLRRALEEQRRSADNLCANLVAEVCEEHIQHLQEAQRRQELRRRMLEQMQRLQEQREQEMRRPAREEEMHKRPRDLEALQTAQETSRRESFFADQRQLNIELCRQAVGDQVYEQAKRDVIAKRQLQPDLPPKSELEYFVASLSARSGSPAAVSVCYRLLEPSANRPDIFQCDSVLPEVCLDIYRRRREQTPGLLPDR
jgi:hypothetical protein